MSKTAGAADAIDERTPASFSIKAFEKASAVSSSEFIYIAYPSFVIAFARSLFENSKLNDRYNPDGTMQP